MLAAPGGRAFSSAALLGTSPRWDSELGGHPEGAGQAARPSYTLHLPGDAWLDPTQADDAALGGCVSPLAAARPFSTHDYSGKPSLEYMLCALHSPGAKPSGRRAPAALPPLESLGAGSWLGLAPAAPAEPAAPEPAAPPAAKAAVAPSELTSGAGQESQALSMRSAKR